MLSIFKSSKRPASAGIAVLAFCAIVTVTPSRSTAWTGDPADACLLNCVTVFQAQLTQFQSPAWACFPNSLTPDPSDYACCAALTRVPVVSYSCGGPEIPDIGGTGGPAMPSAF